MNFKFVSGRNLTFDDSQYDETELVLLNTWSLGQVDSRMISVIAPYCDGDNYYGQTLGSRTITIPYVLMATSRSELFDLVRTVKSVFNPKDGLGLLTITMDGGDEYVIWCVPEGTPYAPAGNQRGVWYQTLILTLKVPYPFFIDPAYHSFSISGFSGGFVLPLSLPWTFGEVGQQIDVENNGDSPTPLIVTFLGEITNPRIDNLTTDEYLKAVLALGAGEVLEINTAQGQHTVHYIHGGTTDNGFGYLTTDSKFFWLEPGTNTLSFTSSGALGATAACAVLFYDQYLEV